MQTSQIRIGTAHCTVKGAFPGGKALVNGSRQIMM